MELESATSEKRQMEGGLADCEPVRIGWVLELNSILQHPKFAADLMVKGGVKPGIALQFVSNIKRFARERQMP